MFYKKALISIWQKQDIKRYKKESRESAQKYFYTLRTLLAMKWIQIKQETAPIEFELLMAVMTDDEELTSLIDQMLV